MTEYYSGLKNGHGRGEALRQALLAMLERKDLLGQLHSSARMGRPRRQALISVPYPVVFSCTPSLSIYI